MEAKPSKVAQVMRAKLHKDDADLNSRQNRFLQGVKVSDKITSRKYAKKMEVSTSTALRDLKKMKSKGFVKKVGQRKGSYFEVIVREQK